MTTSKLIQKSHLNSKKDSSKEINFFLNYELWWEKFKQYHMKKQYFIQTQKQQPMKDLTKILKDGDEVYYTVTGEMHKVRIEKHESAYPIELRMPNIDSDINWLTKEGFLSKDHKGECLIFPSKEERNWDNFKRKEEFKKGDLCAFWDDNYSGVKMIGIYDSLHNGQYHSVDIVNGKLEITSAWDNCEKINIEDYI